MPAINLSAEEVINQSQSERLQVLISFPYQIFVFLQTIKQSGCLWYISSILRILENEGIKRINLGIKQQHFYLISFKLLY